MDIKKTRALNTDLLNSLINDEIQTYYNWNDNRNKLIQFIKKTNQIIELIEDQNYKKLYYAFKEYSVLLEECTGKQKDKINDLFFNIYFLSHTSLLGNSVTEYEQEKINYAESNIKKFGISINDIKKEKLIELDNMTPPITEEKFANYRNVSFSFYKNQPIGQNEYKIIIDFLKEKGYNEEEIIVLLERVRIRNVFLDLNKNGRKLNEREAYRTLDIIQMGYEQIDIPFYEGINKNKINVMLDTCKTLLVDYNFNNAKLALPDFDGIDGFTYGYTKDEFEYLMTNLLKYYQEQMINCYKGIIMLENYTDKEYRKYIVEEFYKLVKLYNNIRDYMYNSIDDYNSVYQASLTSKNEENEIDLYYSLRNSEEISTFFENDLKDIPQDLYAGVIDLITRFKKNTLPLPMCKSLNEVFPGLKEIKMTR